MKKFSTFFKWSLHQWIMVYSDTRKFSVHPSSVQWHAEFPSRLWLWFWFASSRVFFRKIIIFTKIEKCKKKIGSSSYLFSRRSCAVCKESAKSETMMRHRRFKKFDYFEVNVILSIKYLWYFNIFSIRIFEYFCIRLKAVNFYLCMFGVSSTKSG